MKVIEVKDAVKKYRSGKETNLVLDGFSMSVERGTM
jgi:ABC-type dipeptide/oligopeptide/nickel transport system ATPase subunit